MKSAHESSDADCNDSDENMDQAKDKIRKFILLYTYVLPGNYYYILISLYACYNFIYIQARIIVVVDRRQNFFYTSFSIQICKKCIICILKK